jgi:hypothetical protein
MRTLGQYDTPVVLSGLRHGLLLFLFINGMVFGHDRGRAWQ